MNVGGELCASWRVCCKWKALGGIGARRVGGWVTALARVVPKGMVWDV